MSTHPSTFGRALCSLLLCALAVPANAADEFPDSLYYYAHDNPKRQPHRQMEGKPAPRLPVTDTKGKRVSVEPIRGKVVVIDFWATWCGPCLQSIPKNNELVKKYGDDLQFIAVHSFDDGARKIPEIVKRKKISYPVYVDQQGKAAKLWKVRWWPTYAVVDRNGILRAAGLRPGAVGKVVEALMREPGASALPDTWLEGGERSRRRLRSLTESDTPPELVVEDWRNGEPTTLAQLEGKVVLLQFWSTSKAAYLREIKRNNELLARHEKDGLVIIGICDARTAHRMDDYLAGKKAAYPICTDVGSQTGDRYHANGNPDSYLIGRGGRLRGVDIKESRIEKAVAILLAEPPRAH